MLAQVMQPLVVFAAFSALVVACGPSESETDESLLTPLTIETSGGTKRLLVEVADTIPERAQGLMNRHELAADRGMLFVLESEQKTAFWMKDTYIPLDLIFIGHDGTVLRIAINAQPHSLEAIQSVVPVLAVLEVKAGTAITLGIKAGDRVHHAAFGNVS
jgi:uncharacterized membrane protein (UPF0127 family)